MNKDMTRTVLRNKDIYYLEVEPEHDLADIKAALVKFCDDNPGQLAEQHQKLNGTAIRGEAATVTTTVRTKHDYDIGAGTDVKNMYQRSYANMIWHEKPYGPHPLYPHVYDLYGYSELSVDHWVTPKYCSDSERKGLEYLPAGVDYIMRPAH